MLFFRVHSCIIISRYYCSSSTLRKKKDDDKHKLFKQISQYGKNSGWRSSQVTSSVPSQATSPRPTGAGGLIGSASGILDPPRKRPFIKPYNLSGLRYFQTALQQLKEPEYSRSDSYDSQLENAQHYSKYLARLMLNLRRRRGQNTFLGTQYYSHALSYQRKLQRMLYLYRSARANRSTRAMYWFINNMKQNPRRFPEIPWPDPFKPTPPEPILYQQYTAKFRKRYLDDPPTPWPGSPSRPETRWTDRFDSPNYESLLGGRWILIKVVRISKTQIRKTFLHTKTKERKTRTYYKPLGRRSQSSYYSHRFREQYAGRTRYRRRF